MKFINPETKEVLVIERKGPYTVVHSSKYGLMVFMNYATLHWYLEDFQEVNA